MNNPKRILIADDDEGLVDALARRCQALDLRVERAYDGMSALVKIDALEPDLVILDVNMPSGSGLSVCEMVAPDPHLKAIPIIILTGRTDGETIATCNRLDAYYVPKGPNIWSRLAPLVVDLLGIGRSQAAGPEQPHVADTCRADDRHRRPAGENGDEDAEPETATDRIRNRYIADLFAALGWREPRRAGAPATTNLSTR